MKKSVIKRMLSSLLVLVMVLSAFPADTFLLIAQAAENVNEKYNLIIDFDYAEEQNVTTPESALSSMTKSNRTKSSAERFAAKWKTIYDGDYKCSGGNLRTYLESKDTSNRYIRLEEDVKCTSSHDDYEEIVITSNKVLDLNGHTIELYDKRNKIDTADWDIGESYDQSTTPSDHMSYMFQISNGATLTIIDSTGTDTDPGRIYANAMMINHQKWDFWYYTHRDIFLVSDGNLVIYGGEFQAGRQCDLYKSNFSWNGLREVIGTAVTLGTSIMSYVNGVDAAKAADQDLQEQLYYEAQKEAEEDGDAGNSEGATKKKDGTGDTTKDTKKDTPQSVGAKGDASAKVDKTIAEKQTDKNTGKQDNAERGDQNDANEANEEKTAKFDKFTRLAESQKNIANAYFDADSINAMVDGAFDLVKGIAGLIGNDTATRCTACIQGTVAKVSQGGTLVTYGGKFIGHGSTPNVRNGVIEVERGDIKNKDEKSAHYGKYNGGYAYIYGGEFDAYTGANVFNMVKTNNNLKATSFVYAEDGTRTVQKDKTLAKSETCGMEVLQFEDLETWIEEYEKASEAEKKAMAAPDSIDTSNVVVRNGTFRCHYEVTNMAVLEDRDYNGTGVHEGLICPEHQKEDGCDDYDYRKFTGTPGGVNLGVNSFDKDLIRDGRIQLVDVYGQGELVLLDGGDPVYTEDNLQVGKNNKYKTEGDYRHYRLFVGDTELRASTYLQAYPNDAKANSSYSFNLRTYWGAGDNQTELWTSEQEKEDKVWASDVDNIRAPHSSNEKYFEFVYDDVKNDGDGISANYYVVPNLKNTDPQGTNLDSSNVWYYNVPIDADNDPIVSPSIILPQFYYSGGTSQVGYFKEDYYSTNMKWFTYKVYRVDPLSRENINESEVVDADEPLIEVCYGSSNDSLKCKLPLLYLEEEIQTRLKEEKGIDWPGYQSGEMYRIVFSVEEHMAYGTKGTDRRNNCVYGNEMSVSTTESSILFLCVSEDEKKEETYVDPADGKTKIHNVPDFTSLHFEDESLNPGDTAKVELINGQTGVVDWVGDKIFDIYYQWWEVDEEGNDVRLLAGTDNIWVAQDTVGKNNHRIASWIIDQNGQGINGEQYYNTVDPNSSEANAYQYGANGLPVDIEDWDNEMLHMYTLETSGQNVGLRLDKNLPLDRGNNNATWGNTDSCYIPEEMAGKYIQARVIAVNCKYPTYYDNKQTIKSHVIRVAGTPGFVNQEPKGNDSQITWLEATTGVPQTYSFNNSKPMTGYTVDKYARLEGSQEGMMEPIEAKVINGTSLLQIKHTFETSGTYKLTETLVINKDGETVETKSHVFYIVVDKNTCEHKDSNGNDTYEVIENTATCTKAGEKTERCTQCGHTKVTALTASGHKPCTEEYAYDDWKHWHVCEYCNQMIDEANHTGGDSCSVCTYNSFDCEPEDMMEWLSDDACHWIACVAGHDCPNDGKLYKSNHIAYVREPGWMDMSDNPVHESIAVGESVYSCQTGFYCSECLNYYGEKNIHKWVLDTSKSDETKDVYVCEYDGDYLHDGHTKVSCKATKTVKKGEHIHEWDMEHPEVITAASCTASGTSRVKCKTCDETFTFETLATGHTWGEWDAYTPPARGESIEISCKCTNPGCNETKTRIIKGDPNIPFTDVAEGKWYYEPVAWGFSNGVVSGLTTTQFGPKASCTRGQIVTFIWRAEGKPVPKNRNHSFTDVEEGKYYYDAMLWAFEEGIVNGYTDTTFAPNATCTRAQMATFLYRHAGNPTVGTANCPFTDIAPGKWYYNAAIWASDEGIVSGYGNGIFAPNDTVTRDQTVAMLYRYFAQ